MTKWIEHGLGAIKVFIVFGICLFVFYYGILWLSNSYEGDERLDHPQKEAEQVFEAIENNVKT